MKYKYIFLVVIALTMIILLGNYVQRFLYPSEAEVESSAITLNFVQPPAVQVNDEFDVELSIISPTDKKISALRLFMQFDEGGSDLVDFVNATIYSSENASTVYFDEAPIQQDVTHEGNVKQLRVVFLDPLKQTFSQYSNNLKVKFRMKAKAIGTTNLRIFKEGSTLAGSQGVNTVDFQVEPDLISTPVTIIAGNSGGNSGNPSTGTVTPTIPEGSVPVNIKARFQGIVQPPANTRLIVRAVFIPTEQNTQITRDIEGTFLAEGVWEGRTHIPFLNTTQNYFVYLQAPKYLKKKFCDSTPVATDDAYTCTDPAITFTNGDNVLDFSGVHVLVGDVSAPYGVIDSVDIVGLRNNLYTGDETTETLYDLNLNDEVEVQDHSLPVKAITIQNTDDE